MPTVELETTARRQLDEEEREGLLSGSLDETAALPADLGQSGFDVVPEGQHALSHGTRSQSKGRHQD